MSDDLKMMLDPTHPNQKKIKSQGPVITKSSSITTDGPQPSKPLKVETVVEEVKTQPSKPLKVEIVVEDVSKMKIKTDVLVSSCDEELSCTEGISRIIRASAGPEYEKELRALQAAKKKSLSIGDVKVTTGGKMLCTHIFHTVPPLWDNYVNEKNKTIDKVKAFTDLQETFTSCLKEASDKGHRSIMFPLLGVGTGFNKKLWWEVAEATFRDYPQKNPNTSLEKVFIIDYSQDSVNELITIRGSK